MPRQSVRLESRRGYSFNLDLSHNAGGDELVIGSGLLTIRDARGNTVYISDDLDQLKRLFRTLFEACYV